MKKLISVLAAVSVCLAVTVSAAGASLLRPTDKNSGVVTRHFVTENEDGAEIHSAPDAESKVLLKLNKGDPVKATRRYYNKTIGIYSDWYYTVVDGTGGWIDAGGGTGRFVSDVKYREDVPALLGSAVTLAECPLYGALDFAGSDNPEDGAISLIPAGTELTFDLYCLYDGIVYGRVNFGGKEGWAAVDDSKNNSALCGVDGYIMTAGEKPLYKDGKFSPGEQSGKTADAFRIYQYDFVLQSTDGEGGDFKWYRIAGDDGIYWIKTGYDDYDCAFYGGEEIRVTGGAHFTMYSSPDTSSGKAGEIPSDSSYIQLFSIELPGGASRRIWDFVMYEDSFGWAERENGCPDMSVVTGAEHPLNTLCGLSCFTQTDYGKAEPAANTGTPEKARGEDEGSRISPALMFCVGGAAAAVLAAILITGAIKKKKQ